MSEIQPLPPATLIAGLRPDTCLGYANTLFWRGRETPAENLRAFADVVRWAGGNAGLGPEGAEAWLRWAQDHDAATRILFAEAITLREALYRMFSALAAGIPVTDADLAALNRAMAEAPPRRQLARSDGTCAWHIEPEAFCAPALLAPALWTAADLLARGNPARVRQCANPQCLWLFLDESKNGARRWCDMTSCGNRAKARRHYLKHKKV